MSERSYDVLGIGNAIVDVIAHAEDDFLVAHRLAKGAMTLIDEARAEALYQAMGPARIVSGGCAANTAAGVASFGGRAAFIGKVRDDTLGEIFAQNIHAFGVAFETRPAKAGAGRCVFSRRTCGQARRQVGTPGVPVEERERAA